MKRLLLALPFVLAFLGGIGLISFPRYLFSPLGFFPWIGIYYGYITIIVPIVFALSAALFFKKHKLAAWIYLALAVLLGLVRVYATYIEPYALEIRHETFKSPKIDRTIRLLHVSDIQSDGIGAYEQRVFDCAAALNPDIVIYTGDYLQLAPGRDLQGQIDKLRSLTQSLSPPLGQYGTDGNVGHRAILYSLSKERSPMALENKMIEIDEEGVRLRLLGVTFRHCFEPWPEELHQALRDRPDVFTILAGHAPDYVFQIEPGDEVDLCLAGHTHGGQVVFPFFGPLFTASRLPRRYVQGFNEYGGFFLNVSAGIGCEHAFCLPPIRFLRPPELVLITIEPQDGVSSVD